MMIDDESAGMAWMDGWNEYFLQWFAALEPMVSCNDEELQKMDMVGLEAALLCS